MVRYTETDQLESLSAAERRRWKHQAVLTNVGMAAGGAAVPLKVVWRWTVAQLLRELVFVLKLRDPERETVG